LGDGAERRRKKGRRGRRKEGGESAPASTPGGSKGYRKKAPFGSAAEAAESRKGKPSTPLCKGPHIGDWVHEAAELWLRATGSFELKRSLSMAADDGKELALSGSVLLLMLVLN
jgi:hypothetical protein